MNLMNQVESIVAQERELAELIVASLNLEIQPHEIEPAAPLYREGLGLDSIDALEIVVMLESEFGIKVKNESAARTYFRSVASLADFVEQRLQGAELSSQ